MSPSYILENPTFPIRLINSSESKVVLKKGTTVGRLELVAEKDITIEEQSSISNISTTHINTMTAVSDTQQQEQKDTTAAVYTPTTPPKPFKDHTGYPPPLTTSILPT